MGDFLWPVLSDPWTENCTHTEGCAVALLHGEISVYFSYVVKQSCWWDRWLWNGRLRVQQPRITSLSLSKDECHNMRQVLELLALKGNGTQHSDWSDLCSTQNTYMTMSLSNISLRCLQHFVHRFSATFLAKWTWTCPKRTSPLCFRPSKYGP